MMKIVFKGKSSEYEIQRSCFCVDAFVIKDKIEKRDGVDFITSNVELLEFSDDSFTFEEIVKHFNICDSEDMIIVEDFDMKSNKDNQNQEDNIEYNILKSEKIIHENTKQASIQFKNLNFFQEFLKMKIFFLILKKVSKKLLLSKNTKNLKFLKIYLKKIKKLALLKLKF